MRMKTADLEAKEKNIGQEKTPKVLSRPTERKPHILLIYRKMIPSIRLCGHCQMEYLAGQGAVEYRAVQEMKLKNSDLNWADTVLLGRLDSWYERRLTELLYESGKYLAYIIDDDLLNIPSEISSAAYYNQSDVQENIRMMLALSDAVLSPSPILLKKYAGGKCALQIEEPAIDPVPYKPHDPNAPVRIGFAGSIDRTGDVEHILKDALIHIRQKYGDRVRFEFFGALPSFAKALGARCIPYCDSYDEYRRTLNALEWDIGLAPMPDTPFHACKHYNKFVEYGAAGVVGIFSDVEPYKQLKKLRGTQMLCENTPQAWELAIIALIEEPRIREEMRRKVCSYLQDNFSVAVSAKSLESLHQISIRMDMPTEQRLNLPILKLQNMLLRFYRGILSYRMGLFKKLWNCFKCHSKG